VKFYALCALFIVLFRRQSVRVFAIPVALFFSALLVGVLLTRGWFVSATALRLISTFLLNAQFIVFMFIGVAFHYLHQRIIPERIAYLFVAVLFFLFSIQWSSGPHSGAFSQMWNYGLALLTFMVAFTFPRLFRSNRVFDFLADISYPLYVVHGVAGFAAMRVLLDNGVPPFATQLLVSAACLFVAWPLHKSVEAPSQAWIKTWNRPALTPAGRH
jgi:peptidoglycan/LPS O-acetylase OafA/YrhL